MSGWEKNRATISEVLRESKKNQVIALKRQISWAGLPEPAEEVRFHPERKWRFDLAFPDLKVAVEYEGGTWGAALSRHTTAQGFRGDAEKYAEAAIAGWIVVRVTADMVRDGLGASLIRRAVEARQTGAGNKTLEAKRKPPKGTSGRIDV